MILKKIFSLFVIIISLSSCVEVYDKRYTFQIDILTVDGLLTDGATSTIRLRRAKGSGQSYYAEPLRNCKVEIVVGNTTAIPLQELTAGDYITPNNFRAIPNQSYLLRFTTPDGNSYESQPQQMQVATPIGKASFKFNKGGILDRVGTRVLASSLDVYIDYEDPKSAANYYMWRWIDYEQQYICASCEGGKLDSRTEECVSERNSRVTYDYVCKTNCWEIIEGKDINIFSDVYTNGLTVKDRLIGQIPYYDLGGTFVNRNCLVEVQQYSLNRATYEYYKLLRDQAQNTGSLTDTPPAAIVGNVRNLKDSNEKIGGFFGVAGVSTTRIFIDKTPYRNDALKFLMLGRIPNLEPDSQPAPPLFEVRPPMATCKLSSTRTPYMPTGWIF